MPVCNQWNIKEHVPIEYQAPRTLCCIDVIDVISMDQCSQDIAYHLVHPFTYEFGLWILCTCASNFDAALL